VALFFSQGLKTAILAHCFCAYPENLDMPLPQEPTRPLTNAKSAQADKELLFKAVLCVLIGLGVLISPYFIESPGMQGIVAQSSLVGWFALVLGAGFGVAYGRRMMRPRH